MFAWLFGRDAQSLNLSNTLSPSIGNLTNIESVKLSNTLSPSIGNLTNIESVCVLFFLS
jgi:hypothetical protein